MVLLQQNDSSVTNKPPALSALVFFLPVFSNHQPHRFHLAPVLGSAGNDVNAGGVDVRVSKNVRQLCNVMVDTVKCPCEQVAQAVGEHLAWRHVCSFAQGFHLPPDVAPVHGLARPGDEYRAGAELLFPGIPPQLLT